MCVCVYTHVTLPDGEIPESYTKNSIGQSMYMLMLSDDRNHYTHGQLVTVRSKYTLKVSDDYSHVPDNHVSCKR